MAPTITVPPNIFGSLALCLLCSSSLLQAVHAKTFYVNPGQSIQAAINSAAAGDRVQVAAGTYSEQVLINKDGIDLRGSSAVLTSPGGTSSPCRPNGSGSVGICIKNDGKTIKDVSVSGFTVQTFDYSIYVSKGSDVSITNNKVVDAIHDGIVAFDSAFTKIQSNDVTGRHDGSGIVSYPGRGNKIAQNTVKSFATGIDTNDEINDVENNIISDTCVGILVQGVSPLVSHNKISSNFMSCGYPSDAYVTGVFVQGASNAKIDHNTITDLKYYGEAAGIRLDLHGPEAPTGTILDTNTVSNADHCVLLNGLQATQKNTKCTNIEYD